MVELSVYCGYFLASIVVEADSATSSVRILLSDGEAGTAVIELCDVVYVTMNGEVSDSSFIDDLVVCELPRRGPWPADTHHLLHLHNNDREQIWLKVVGPQGLEVVAAELVVSHHPGGTKSHTNMNPSHRGGAGANW
jgi:hypothetical protein